MKLRLLVACEHHVAIPSLYACQWSIPARSQGALFSLVRPMLRTCKIAGATHPVTMGVPAGVAQKSPTSVRSESEQFPQSVQSSSVDGSVLAQ